MSLSTWKTELSLAARLPDTGRNRAWLADVLQREVTATEMLASRFRPDSEVSNVNRAAGSWVSTSWEFVALLTASLNAAAATDGLVDPLLGAHIVRAGYDGWAGQDSHITCKPSDHRWDSVEIKPGRTQAAVRIPADSALDLGAVTKGWLADRLTQMVFKGSGADCLANMGGDLRVISPSRPWVIAAVAEEHGLETVMEAEDVGLATSGVGHRAWSDGHHLIDPRTGEPADTRWSSVSVLAETAADANTASTAAIVLGSEGPQWLTQHGLDGWFVGEGCQQTVGQWAHLDVSAA